jgi:hypothetical protein
MTHPFSVVDNEQSRDQIADHTGNTELSSGESYALTVDLVPLSIEFDLTQILLVTPYVH